jgi:hypothetical protein
MCLLVCALGLLTPSVPLAKKSTTTTDLAARPLLPIGWQATDIGTAVPGKSVYSRDQFVMQASGGDISGTRDEFGYTFRAVSGDVDIVARLSGISNTNAWTKAGLMIRESLTTSAAHASVFGSANKGVSFERRTLAGGESVHSDGGQGKAPVWLKLERRGDRVTAYRSADGSAWSIIGEDDLSLPETFYVGLALSSHNAKQLATAVMDNVTVRMLPKNLPPVVTMTAPVTGTTTTLGGSMPLTATASDSDGSVMAVDFLANGTLVDSDSTAPYAVTWKPAAEGNYAITAVARDDAGSSTTSEAVLVTVPAAPSQPASPEPTPAPSPEPTPSPDPAPAPSPRILTFDPSPDHVSLVDFYQLEVFTAGGTDASAVLVHNLGKPAIIGGEISVDVTAVLAPLPAGDYVAVVSAIGIGGTGSSELSPAFSR